MRQPALNTHFQTLNSAIVQLFYFRNLHFSCLKCIQNLQFKNVPYTEFLMSNDAEHIVTWWRRKKYSLESIILGYKYLQYMH